MKLPNIRSKFYLAAAVVVLAAFVGLLAADAVHAATPPGFKTLGWNIKKGQWAEGNIGTYPEGTYFGTQVKITNGTSSPMTLTEIDISYSFFDGSSAIGIDWARRFFYSTTTAYNAGDTDRYPYSGPSLTPDPGWQEFPGDQPYIWNMPWAGTIGAPATSEDQNAPYQEHFWGIDPAGLLPGGVLAPGQSLAIYFEPHLSLSFIWLNGKEGLLPIEGTWTGPDVDRSGWTAEWEGSGFFPGSKMHGYLQSDVTGKKTLPVPAVTMLNGIIEGTKYADLDVNGDPTGDDGIPNWPVSLEISIDGLDITLDTVTDSNGHYIFDTLPDAEFHVVEGAPPTGYEDWKPTPGTDTEATLHLPLLAGESDYGTPGSREATVNFFNWPKVPVTVVTDLSTNTITLGDSVTDTVTVSNTVPSVPLVPSGTVDFTVSYNSGPFLPWTGSTGVALDGSGQATSPAYTPMATGDYVFKASYSGDTNFYPGESDIADPDEALHVDPATPAVVTDLSTNEITLGGSVTDSVTVTGVLGIVPTGTVDFTVSYNGGAFAPWAGSTGIALDGSGQATSPTYTPLAAGNYVFKASYSGDSNYLPNGSDIEDPDEALLVNKAPAPATTVLTVTVVDTVTIQSLPSPLPGPTGTVDFQVSYEGGGWTTYHAGVALVSGSATSNPYTLPQPGNYRFRALYSGDSNYESSASGENDEPVSYDDNSS